DLVDGPIVVGWIYRCIVVETCNPRIDLIGEELHRTRQIQPAEKRLDGLEGSVGLRRRVELGSSGGAPVRRKFRIEWWGVDVPIGYRVRELTLKSPRRAAGNLIRIVTGACVNWRLHLCIDLSAVGVLASPILPHPR